MNRSILNDKRFRIAILILVDLAIVAFCTWVSLLMRFPVGSVPVRYSTAAMHAIVIDMLITVGVFWAFRLYHSVWTFISVREVIRIFEAVVLIMLIEISYKMLLQWNMPRSVYFMTFCSMSILVLLSRLSVRFIKNVLKSRKRGETIRTMIIGAGSACAILMEEFTSVNDNHDIICVIDDNPAKAGKYIQGVKIAGGREKIIETAERKDIDEIIIALPSISKQEVSEIVEICSKTSCRVKILPSISSSLQGNIASNVRDITYEDFLMRDPIEIDDSGIDEYIAGKRVMVTGGGGSIGSELCRQIAMRKPAMLVILDIYENNAYSIQQELKRQYRDELDLRTVIASVRDIDRLEYVFDRYKPQIVFHAAAHKHVPLMEHAPCEAIKNNCMGTLNTAKVAEKFKCEKFVLISTDKAVRPTSIMGASKRICEMIIQDMARKSEHTSFAAVRFGNVLGSNGSVIPLFLRQIEEGGPVTVTHREITRFFMTIPEAVSLVLQAGAYAKGGEIFVLDMGKQIKIYDLAENLIRMKGLKPNEDIMIEIVGLRPGEKLYEEVLMDEEGMEKTDNQLIFIGHPLDFDEEAFEKELDELIDAALDNVTDIKERTARLCDTYTITDN